MGNEEKNEDSTREVSKYKARSNADGGQHELGINYWETYAPVFMWTTIRLIIILAAIKRCYARKLDLFEHTHKHR